MQSTDRLTRKKILPVWVIIAGMIVVGSFSIGSTDITGTEVKPVFKDKVISPVVLQATTSEEPTKFLDSSANSDVVDITVPSITEQIPVSEEAQSNEDKTMSFIATGTPIVFSSGEKPEYIKKPDASGIGIQTNDRVVLNYISDVGETVVVAFKLHNLSEADSLAKIKVSSSRGLLVDITESEDVKVVRPIGDGEYLINVDGGARSVDLMVNITAISIGFHPFDIQILPPSET